MNKVKSRYKLIKLVFLLGFAVAINSCVEKQTKINTLWLIGDSTVANYALESNYETKRYPQTGWGQVFQQFFTKDSLPMVSHLIGADSIVVDDRAKGGRSTRTFFQEGRWREVFDQMEPGDLVLIQFGHNDASSHKPARYVNIDGYKEFLRLYIQQTREKNGVPILITPVARNYPWENGHLENCHGDYPAAMKEVSHEMGVLLIDLNELSMNHFSDLGEGYVSNNYFMNLPAGKFEAYPEGRNDNTHFQPEGASEVARLVFNGMKQLEF